MRCDRVREYLPAFASDELGSETTAWVSSHVQTCAACSSIVARHRSIGAALRQVAVREIEPPATLVPDVMSAVGRSRRIVPVPIPPPDLVRVIQDNREQIVSSAGAVLAAGAAAWLVWKAAKSVRQGARTKPGLA